MTYLPTIFCLLSSLLGGAAGSLVSHEFSAESGTGHNGTTSILTLLRETFSIPPPVSHPTVATSGKPKVRTRARLSWPSPDCGQFRSLGKQEVLKRSLGWLKGQIMRAQEVRLVEGPDLQECDGGGMR